QPSESTQLQLADIWVREGNFPKARQSYHEIITRNQSSVEAWRGYLTALHGERDDRSVVSEAQHMPAAIHSQLEKDVNFVVLLAGAHSELKHWTQTVQLLQQARTLYKSHNQTAPAELDVQLAWAMLSDRQTDPRMFLQEVRSRADLTSKQRQAINEI